VVGVIAGDAPAGDEAYRERLLERIRQLELGRRLIWLGNLVHVEPFMNAIDVFVSTSEFETFGMSVCEAMACGKPVAAYRASSVEEVVGDAGVTVETSDFAALVEATERIIGDGDWRDSLGRRARQRVDDCFQPARSFEQVSELYRSVLRAKSRSLPKDGAELIR
jgi:glycosyltransferase involved in cell wall biosynthesis